MKPQKTRKAKILREEIIKPEREREESKEGIFKFLARFWNRLLDWGWKKSGHTSLCSFYLSLSLLFPSKHLSKFKINEYFSCIFYSWNKIRNQEKTLSYDQFWLNEINYVLVNFDIYLNTCYKLLWKRILINILAWFI